MINLQSDVVNTPTKEMWEAMQKAKTGWVIDREDESVNILEKKAAKIMGKEASLFVLTGRMAVLVALMTLAERGHQVILEKYSHILWGEEWGLSYICGLYPKPVAGKSGIMNPVDIEEAINESKFKHRPITDLICIENTHNMAGGIVVNLEQTKSICKLAHKYNAKVLIDGARIFHAAIALNMDVKDLIAPSDMVMFSLVKGLSAPGGAILCGTKEDISKAYINLSRIGAHSFHKLGILASAGIIALESMVDRLYEDQLKAKDFACKINDIDGIEVDLNSVQTNIVMADIFNSGLRSDQFLNILKQNEIYAHKFTEHIIRFTFHRHITNKDIEVVVSIIKKMIRKRNINKTE